MRRPRRQRARATMITGRLRRRSGHDRQPQSRGDQRGRERPARLRQQDREHAQADGRIGEGPPPDAAGSPRAEPQGERDGNRRDRADGVPVLKRRADAVRELVLGERPGPDARRERVGDRQHRPEEDASDHAGHRRAARATRLRSPRRTRRGRRASGPPRRSSARGRPTRAPRARSARRAARTPRGSWRHTKARSGPTAGRPQITRDADEQHQDLGDRGPAELRAAGRPEGDRREGGAEYQRDCATCVS